MDRDCIARGFTTIETSVSDPDLDPHPHPHRSALILLYLIRIQAHGNLPISTNNPDFQIFKIAFEHTGVADPGPF
jgi:hypothetical protein